MEMKKKDTTWAISNLTKRELAYKHIHAQSLRESIMGISAWSILEAFVSCVVRDMNAPKKKKSFYCLCPILY